MITMETLCVVVMVVMVVTRLLLLTEILTLLHGLQLYWDFGYRKVACVPNLTHLIDLVKSNINI